MKRCFLFFHGFYDTIILIAIEYGDFTMFIWLVLNKKELIIPFEAQDLQCFFFQKNSAGILLGLSSPWPKHRNHGRCQMG